MFIRVANSNQGYFDIDAGQAGQVLVSNGPSLAPTFQDPPGNVIRGFSYTQGWELEHLEAFGGFNFGLGNFTSEFERDLLGGTRLGPATYTSPGDHPWAKRI